MKKRNTSALRLAAVGLSITLGLILTLALGGTLYLRHLLGSVNHVDPQTAPTLTQEELDAYLATEATAGAENTAPTMEPEDVEFGEHDTQIGGEESEILNILLIGQDREPGEIRARSDSMILCTFNKKEKTLTMTSFLRDLYVKIPGYRDNRINASYAAGGMSMLNKTLETNFGIHIDGNMEVDFAQFADIIDLLGGVELELRQDEARVINRVTGSDLTEGTHLLTGAQALAFARIRKLDSDGDFSRTERQRTLITALISAYKDAGLSTILPLAKQILPLITTDMSSDTILEYASELFPLLTDATIISQRIPADGTYSAKTIRGMAVLVADLDAARLLLQDTLNGNQTQLGSDSGSQHRQSRNRKIFP